MDIRTVTVLGVTGTMGANVAGIFASFGNAKVYCIARNAERAESTIPRIARSVRADAIKRNLVAMDFSNLEMCVADSDLVFESCSEDMGVKKRIARRVGAALRSDAVSCTGTSGLSIEEIAQCYPEQMRSRFFGVHMFNPPYVMTLCELAGTKSSDQALKTRLHSYLETVLHRTVVEVKDSPAFLGNRIGFQLINEAMQNAERYQDSGGIDYIDAIIGPFTGRAMPPLVTSDFVGLDVHKAIVDNVFANTEDYAHSSFILPEFARRLVEAGRLGRKTGGGLYRLVRHEGGLRQMMVYDIGSDNYRDVIPYVFPFAETMRCQIAEGDYLEAFRTLAHNRSTEARICLGTLLRYIVYSLYAAEALGDGCQSADDVMATGFNWCPPVAMYHALASAFDVRALIEERIPEVCGQVDIERLLTGVERSRYDYRPFFRSGR